MEPGTQGRIVPVTQDGDAGFHKGRNAEDAEMSTEIAVVENTALASHRAATNAAGLCRELVVKTASKIQGKRYVQVEGWQAIANTFGCVASARDVERIEGGFRATGQVIRLSDGKVLAEAEGFVGDDEQTWAKRPVFARRAMAQTRAMSRACRSAFAFVVTLMDAGLETTPAEEMTHVDAEPVVVRPKFDTPPAPAEERVNAYEVAQAAIEGERDIAKLDAMRARIDQRLKQGTFTPFQADELLDQIHARVEFLEAEQEVVA